ncbi:hypothetical protein [Clostridium sp.]|uniref:hypothetical protein n=1 Tax=Clostridium sp. TaxID=1506 RepID=UPI002604CB56|nr:hypothetical protein [Clostridium sp.]
MKFSLLKNSNNENSKSKKSKSNPTNTSEKKLSNESNSILEPDIKYDNKMFINKKDDYAILDKDIIGFISQNFPEASSIISDSLMNLKNTIETSIDIIEDTSSKIIKDKRNFSLSSIYRDTSISLYKISNNIESYINWMSTLKKDNLEHKEEEVILYENSSTNFSENLSRNLTDNLSLSQNNNNSKNEFNIFSDFTDKIPKAFIIDFKEIIVDDWNDLVIKTADSLIKIYRSSKEVSYNEINIPELSSKKSFQNEFRDTIIEMLIEYNIKPSRYKIIVY